MRRRGAKCFPGAVGWQKPEIRNNLGEALTLADPISRNDESSEPTAERMEMWRMAHSEQLLGSPMSHCQVHVKVKAVLPVGVPRSVVVAANEGELAARLHFEAEHTNVLVVTVELLNGCLASTEIENITAKIVTPGIPEFPVRHSCLPLCTCLTSCDQLHDV